jgi:7-cyano-7-deazaguanine reductase
MANRVDDSALGQKTEYLSVYTPGLLFPIARRESRAALGLVDAELPFSGVDVWTGYELSWLDEHGKPRVALAEFVIPCTSEFIVESKSFKLYLNSFNQTRFAGMEQVRQLMQEDLSRAVGARISVNLFALAEAGQQIAGQLPGESLDDLEVAIEHYHPAPELLRADDQSASVEEVLCSDLLKSNCPVTGQPDWASVQIRYRGPKIEREGLLRYIVSFREHQDFHEHCVERMFMDILQRCRPEQLTVYARYTRRGGLDINPWRSNCGALPEPVRLVRQ